MVTGAGGFIGSHLAEALLGCGANVRALVHYNSRNDWGKLERLPTEMRAEIQVVAGDIRDPFFLERLLADVEIVFHLAALAPIPYSTVAPAQYVETNVRGTLNVLEACRRHGVARLVHTSTSEVYGTALYTPIDEAHPLQAQSPYAASKIGADKLVEAYWRSFGVPVVTVRPFNAYGPRQSARAFVPSVIAQALTSDLVRVGSLDAIRDMNFVADTVAGFLAAATVPGIEGLTFNLGSGVGLTMRDLLERSLDAVGRPCDVEIDEARVRDPRYEVRELVADSTLASEKLDWRSEVNLDEGLKRTAAWIEEHLKEFKPSIYNL